MSRLGAVLALVLFAGACLAMGCGAEEGIDASYDCGRERIYVDCDQDTQPGAVSGYIGPDIVAFSCPVNLASMDLSPQHGLEIRAWIRRPAVGAAGPGSIQIYYARGCAPLESPDRGPPDITATIDEFEPSSHIRGTFDAKLGNLHGTFNLTCGDGQVFCSNVSEPAPSPPSG